MEGCDQRAHDRFCAPAGWLELTVTQRLLELHLPSVGAVLDVGSGTDTYAQWLRSRDLHVVRAETDDHERSFALGLPSAADEVVDADVRDLSRWDDGTFDVTMALGPFHRSVRALDRDRALSELVRVTRPGGLLAVSFIPRYVFLRHLLQHGRSGALVLGDPAATRGILTDGQVLDAETGAPTDGFAADPAAVVPLVEQHGVETLLLGSTHGFATEMETQVDAVRRLDGDLGGYDAVVELLVQTATDPSILGLAGHLLYVGRVQG